MSESQTQREIMLAVSKAGARVFRNNVAEGWIGRAIGPLQRDTHMYLPSGTVVIEDARRLHSGLCVGSGDLIGWTPRIVTPEQVGHKVGIFTSIEVKSKTGRLTAEQKQFMNAVRASGGLAGVARSVEEALEGLR